jgi:hypothetical protein
MEVSSGQSVLRRQLPDESVLRKEAAPGWEERIVMKSPFTGRQAEKSQDNTVPSYRNKWQYLLLIGFCCPLALYNVHCWTSSSDPWWLPFSKDFIAWDRKMLHKSRLEGGCSVRRTQLHIWNYLSDTLLWTGAVTFFFCFIFAQMFFIFIVMVKI